MDPVAMTAVLRLEQIGEGQRHVVGGKAWNLAQLARAGQEVPTTVVLPTTCYAAYVGATGLGERILMELGRKEFAAMRWEELWDASLRIRNLFLTTPLPAAQERDLLQALRAAFDNAPLVVRSSAPGEDAERSSFAGLHDSFVNVAAGPDAVAAVRKVWASLWSDRALLYRQELGLDVHDSAMAVVVQPLQRGERSGVAFGRSPDNPRRVTVESVWGLNQGLVDGSVEPDSWQIDRELLVVVERRPAERSICMTATADGVAARPLETEQKRIPPLADHEAVEVARAVLALEKLFGVPQDMEWTYCGGRLVLLQARPISTLRPTVDDERTWLLTLRRSFENLKVLRHAVEEEFIPAMEEAAQELSAVDLPPLSDGELAAEIRRRRAILDGWEGLYREQCIPLAHGVRLFGEFYNDAVMPDDPFAFVALLQGSGMQAVQRNECLETLAGRLRAGETLAAVTPSLAPLAAEMGIEDADLARIVTELSRSHGRTAVTVSEERLQETFLAHFDGERRRQAEDILDLARASYRLRDDDNIAKGKIRHRLEEAEEEARRRLGRGADGGLSGLFEPGGERKGGIPATAATWQTRQVQGQPASAGIASGQARIAGTERELAHFRAGEVLVCDALDPTMTFVAPLAAAIVERRGGMLIHGAIIAREYGIPCVTGVPDAVRIIRTGQRLTVDGYLGLVILED